ncbi:acyl-CoA carboxylase epsilon subunit [Kocuria sp.]|uniref:acyl-CoA carboxylase epsilon subunit n=1 Tax=Kocuria sp. TaxID=1871328 RepID=UPI0026DAFA08|nr:acyl-CoA carboxylase epsilon subunit [Kocuria sp.]MDO4919680.1 acyl-CoA carboxylase epsilon subunit [Kocuria sp.]
MSTGNRIGADHRFEAVAALPDTEDTQEPLFTVTRGNPTAEELAALVAALGTLSGPQQPSAVRPSRITRSQSRRVRLGLRLRPGRGAWRWTQPER